MEHAKVRIEKNLIGILEDPTFCVGKVDDFGIRFDLLPWIRYEVQLVATNQDVLLFKLLTFLGVLLTETCYYYHIQQSIKG